MAGEVRGRAPARSRGRGNAVPPPSVCCGRGRGHGLRNLTEAVANLNTEGKKIKLSFPVQFQSCVICSICSVSSKFAKVQTESIETLFLC